MTKNKLCCATPNFLPISRIFPSLGSKGKKDSTFPSSVTVVCSEDYKIVPSIALIYKSDFRVWSIFWLSGAVGKGNIKTSGIPMVLSCSSTLSKGSLDI
jgi:hypothetical protein